MAKKKTECYPFWNLSDIKKMIDGFTEKKQWHWRLAFMIELLMGRRVGDTLDFQWIDFYYTNGNKKTHLEIEEEKSHKMTYVLIPALVWSELDLYVKNTGVNPAKNNYTTYIFPGTDRKDAAYREAFKKVANKMGINYRVNTHSARKTFGYYGIKLHPYDPSNLDVLQKFFNHSSREITLRYIGLTQEKQDQYSSDWGNVMSDIVDGKDIAIENTPVVTLKTEDLRAIIIMALKENNTTESLNKILRTIEEKQVV